MTTSFEMETRSTTSISGPPDSAVAQMNRFNSSFDSTVNDSLTMTMDDDQQDPGLLDLSSKQLQKLTRAAPEFVLNTTTLILDDNALQRLDNIHTFQCLEKLSVQNNRLIRMFQVSKLSHLKVLNLTNNHITTMEGLKDLKLLTWLSLAGNHVKTIDQLNQNVHLEHLDLSANQISLLSDLSYLKNLKALLLHKNQIETLNGCDKFLPNGLGILTLNDNHISNLTDMSHISHLSCLEQLTISANPATNQPEDKRMQFDYRPYVINWCLSLRILDGFMVGAKESLKAEWMYSQSRGRQFVSGQHDKLVEYLLQTCPLHPGEDWQEDKKLNLILSKVQEHQQSLRDSLPLAWSSAMPSRNLVKTSDASSSRFVANLRCSSSRSATASCSLSTTPTATPTMIRRSSLGSGRSSAHNVRCSGSRTSPSPHRQRNSTPTSASSIRSIASYNVSLPRTLYGDDSGDDINGNLQHHHHHSMTQSMDPSQLACRLENADLMTASLDPSLLMTHVEGLRSKPYGCMKYSQEASSTSPPSSLSSQLLHRPSSLFAADGLKDLYLQDVSDGETTTQSLTYCRLQSRLNPVPESLNSPDMGPSNLNQPSINGSSVCHLADTNHPELLAAPSKMNSSTSPSHNQDTSNETSKSDDVSRSSAVPAAPPTMEQLESSFEAKSTSHSQANQSSSHLSTLLQAENYVPLHKDEDDHRQPATAVAETQCDLDMSPNQSKQPTKKPRATRRSSSQNLSNSTGLPKKSLNQIGPGRVMSTDSPRRASTLPSVSSVKKNSETKTASIHTNSSNIMNNVNDNRRPNSASTATLNHNSRSNNMNSISTKSVVASCNANKHKDDHEAAMMIQKSWRGHSTRTTNQQVQDLRDEVRTLRTDQHIRHLTKELAVAKQALERERKLRVLQMDAIKVLWKEVQIMDDAYKISGCHVGNGKGSSTSSALISDTTDHHNQATSRSRPSGSSGSKISSRQSEHSIAKLMETLEATACIGLSNKDKSGFDPDEMAPGMMHTTSTTTTTTLMAQSMPPSVLRASDELTTISDSNRDQVIDNLSKTCSSLQKQMEQLQSSLMDVMQCVSSISSSIEIKDRHASSVASNTLDSVNYCTSSTEPQSLPPVTVSEGVTSLERVGRSIIPLTSAEEEEDALVAAGPSDHREESNQSTPRSPRPQTLPGLPAQEQKSEMTVAKIPTLAQLADSLSVHSMEATEKVKTFSANLAENILAETFARQYQSSKTASDCDDKESQNVIEEAGRSP